MLNDDVLFPVPVVSEVPFPEAIDSLANFSSIFVVYRGFILLIQIRTFDCSMALFHSSLV